MTVLSWSCDRHGCGSHMTAVAGKISRFPFWTRVKINDDATTSVEIYQKSTHTDQYLNFQSNHHLEHKRSVVRTLLNRAHNLITMPEDQASECKHVKAVLKDNAYKPWAFRLPRPKVKESSKDANSGFSAKSPVCIPYVSGVSEKLNRVFCEHGVSTFHKLFNTIKSMLPTPKDKSPDDSNCGIIYEVQCSQCRYIYVGETGRTLSTHIKEHLNPKRVPTAVGDHIRDTGLNISPRDFRSVAHEDLEIHRKIREAVEIRVWHPEMNRDTGYDLPPVFLPLLSCDCRRHGGHMTN